jgi:methylenetetrahydrofolate reductase (NADPH)
VKLRKKVQVSAGFLITQVGYDARKFHELLCVQRDWNMEIPTLGSVFVLTHKVASLMAKGEIPGAVVTKKLLKMVAREWQELSTGKAASIERSARLVAVLKGLGYRGVHFGGIHKSFKIVSRILDRMARIEHRWREFVPEFDFPQENGYYVYLPDPKSGLCSKNLSPQLKKASYADKAVFQGYRAVHYAFFRHNAPFASKYAAACAWLDAKRFGEPAVRTLENVPKKLLFSCQQCGDCGLQHLAFFCPESQCPKHTRNGPCGGSRKGACEVYPDRRCVWFRAYRRWASVGRRDCMAAELVPPRMWELNESSSWINFHLKKDHQGVPLVQRKKSPG